MLNNSNRELKKINTPVCLLGKNKRESLTLGKGSESIRVGIKADWAPCVQITKGQVPTNKNTLCRATDEKSRFSGTKVDKVNFSIVLLDLKR